MSSVNAGTLRFRSRFVCVTNRCAVFPAIERGGVTCQEPFHSWSAFTTRFYPLLPGHHTSTARCLLGGMRPGEHQSVVSGTGHSPHSSPTLAVLLLFAWTEYLARSTPMIAHVTVPTIPANDPITVSAAERGHNPNSSMLNGATCPCTSNNADQRVECYAGGKVQPFSRQEPPNHGRAPKHQRERSQDRMPGGAHDTAQAEADQTEGHDSQCTRAESTMGGYIRRND